MRVKLFPLDTWGCGHYRMYWPAAAVAELEGHGFDDVSIVAPDERRVAIKLGWDGRVAGEGFPAEAGDVVVFQRPSPLFIPDAIRLLKARGVKVVVDMDDDLAAIHPGSIAWRSYHPKTSNGHSWHAVTESCRLADLVTVTTPQLARRYGAHGRVAILPNVVPDSYLDADHPDSTMIGWSGTVATHVGDLQRVGPAIATLVRSGVTFATVGPPDGVAKDLGLSSQPRSSGPVSIDQYPSTVAQFGIGIAPLARSIFNEAKSRLKPLEYSALGVPWVGTPTEDYRLFHEQTGVGQLAERPKDWLRCLKRLVNDDEFRLEQSSKGREAARAHTFSATAWRWAEAWASLC